MLGTNNQITNEDDMIDVRQINHRIFELENLEDGEPDNILSLEEIGELDSLREIVECGIDEGLLVRDSYLKTYIRDMYETNMMQDWPYNCIDWEQATEEISSDFTSIEFDGVTYWVV